MVESKTTKPRSRQKRTKSASTTNSARKTFSMDGKEVEGVYCRRCQEIKSPKSFYDATDSQLDRNGKMSVCEDCIDDLFNKIFSVEHDVSKTILQLCRMLNVVYMDTGVQATLAHAAKMFDKSGNMPPMFGFYKSKISSFATLNSIGILTFSEPGTFVVDNPMTDDEIEGAHDLKRFWGDGLSFDDYSFLEEELDDWKKTHKSDTKAEITLLKEICFKQLEIRKLREMDKSVDAALKSLQDLMKTCSVDPSKAAIAGAGKSQDTFSSFIKTIEENEPAEVYADKSLFKDYDNIEWYFRKFVSTPLKNFITGSRDFSLEENDENDSEIDLEAILGGDNGDLPTTISEG